MPVFSNALAGAAGSGGAAAGYKIERSLRFNDNDSAYLNKAFTSAGDRQKWTWSGWAKRSTANNTTNLLFYAEPTTSSYTQIGWSGDNFQINIQYNGTTFANVRAAAKSRDVSAWAHYVVVYDSANATSTDRMILYINGVRVTDFASSSYPSQNALSPLNADTTHYIGTRKNVNQYFDGYLAEVHFVDGQVLAPTNFGEFDADTGVWNPKAYSGAHGTNGFYLDFSDNSSNAALGYDAAGSNDWTVNNLVATGVGVGTVGWPNKIGGPQSTYDSAATSSTVDSGTSWSTNGNNNTLHFDTQALGTHTITFTKTGGANDIDFESSSSSNTGYTRVTNSASTITISSTSSSQTHTYNRYVRFSGSGSGNVTFSISGTAQGTDSAAIDSLIDTPTSYEATSGNNGGNYATWNPLFGENQSISNGNLNAQAAAAGYAIIASTLAMTSGKWYMEYHYTSNINSNGDGGNYITFGVSQTNRDGAEGSGVSDTAEDFGFKCWNAGFNSQTNGVNQHNYSSSVSTGDILSLAFDADAGKLWVAKNGTWMTNSSGTGDPANGTNPDFSNLDYSGGYFFMAGPYNDTSLSSELEANFGARPWAYTPPTGFKSLCTQNLDDPTIADGSDYFEARAYNGDTTTSQSGFEFSPDFLWLKSRSNTDTHFLFDTVRGATKYLSTTNTNAEATQSASITSFDSDGFSYGSWGPLKNGSMVAWAWDGGDLATTSDTTNYNQTQTWSNDITTSNGWTANRDGTRAFDGVTQLDGSSNTWAQTDTTGGTVTWTPNGYTIDTADVIYIRAVSSTDRLTVVGSNSTQSNIVPGTVNGVGNVYTVPTTLGTVNSLSVTNPAGLAGFSGIEVGGKLLIDPGVIPAGGLNDSVYNQDQNWATYGTFDNRYDPTSYTWTGVFNTNNNYTSAGSLYVNDTTNGDSWSLTQPVTVASSIKLYVHSSVTVTINAGLSDETTATIGSANQFSYGEFSFTGNVASVKIASSGAYIMGIWFDGKRLVDAAGIPNVPEVPCTVRANPSAGFSIVKVNKPTDTESRAHGLNKKPDLIICKSTASADSWHSYHSSLGYTYYINLNSTNAATASDQFGSQEPDANLFYVKANTGSGANKSEGMIYYIWTAVEGYSSFTSFEGNGLADGPFVYTGFRPAFIMLKNADVSSTSTNWTIFDNKRDGYNVDNDPLYANKVNAEATTDMIDILSNGFKLRSSLQGINQSGQTILVMAFAENPFKLARAR